MDRNPRRGKREIQELSLHATRACIRPRKGYRHKMPYLFQERICFAYRFSQDKLCSCSSLLLPRGGRYKRYNRNGCWSMGCSSFLCSKGVWFGGSCLSSKNILRAEAVQTVYHANIRCSGDSLAFYVYTCRKRCANRRSFQ